MTRRDPEQMTVPEIEAAIDREMDAHPDGSPYATRLIDYYEAL